MANIQGTAGNDTLNGTSGDDVITGGAGNDQITGGDGADVIVFRRGDGQDRLLPQGVDQDVLSFTDLNPADIELLSGTSYSDLVFAVKGSSDSVTISNFFNTTNVRLREVRFADGTVWDHATLMAKQFVLRGTADDDYLFGHDNFPNRVEGLVGNDYIQGGRGGDLLLGGEGDDGLDGNFGNDVLIGGAGNDFIEGNYGADEIVFGRGDGVDQINTSPYDGGVGSQDRLRFTDLNVSDIDLRKQGDDLVFDVRGSDDAVIFRNFYLGPDYQPAYVQFADGTVWNNATLLEQNGVTPVVVGTSGNDTLYGNYLERQRLEGLAGNDQLMSSSRGDILMGGEGDDRLYGFEGDDVLVGGTGNDRIIPGDGADLIKFSRGDGVDVVDNGGGGLTDTLRFTDLNPNDIEILRTGEDLVFSVKNTNDAVVIYAHFYDSRYQLAKVEFANGTVWDNATLLAQPVGTARTLVQGTAGDDVLSGNEATGSRLEGLAGNDTLQSGIRDDILVGGAGNDTLIAGLGADVIVFGRGDGADTVDLKVGVSPLEDTLRFTDINSADIELSRVGNDLVLSVKNSSDSVTITAFFATDDYVHQLKSVEFADGSSWNNATLLAQPIKVRGTGGDDYLLGAPQGLNLIEGLAGNDNISGGHKADVIYGGAGDDLIGGGYGDDVLSGGTGNDRIMPGPGADVVLFGRGDGVDRLNTSAYYMGSSQGTLRFTDINAADIELSTLGNDLVISVKGTADAVILESYLAADGSRLARIEFANGAAWDSATLASHVPAPPATILGTAGNDSLLGNDSAPTRLEGLGGNDTLRGGTQGDTLLGGDGDDTLLGLGGNDLLTGGAGNDQITGGVGTDTITFGRGDGNDRVFVELAGGLPQDGLNFTGLNVADIELRMVGTDLVFALKGSTDTLIIDNFYGINGDPLAQVRFADGTIWDAATLQAQQVRVIGSEGDDHLYGTIGTKLLLEGLGGNDILEGALRGDTLLGGDGNDRLLGHEGNDLLVGGAGNDQIESDLGDDVIVFARSDGQDRVHIYENGSGPEDTLRFTDISATDIELRKSGYDLVLGVKNSSDSVTLNNFYREGEGQLARVEFANGAVWDNAALQAMSLTLGEFITGTNGSDNLHGGEFNVNYIEGLGGNDGLYGGSLGDTLLGGGGDDYLAGGEGGDILVGGTGNDLIVGGTGVEGNLIRFARGDGQDRVISELWEGMPMDTLQFTDINAADIEVQKSGNDLVFAVKGSSDSVTIADFFDSFDPKPSPLSTVMFADGTLWDEATLKAQTLVVIGTNGDDTLVGGIEFKNRLEGGGGNDTLWGRTLDDTLLGGDGNDVLQGAAGDDVLIGGTGNDTLYGDYGSDVIVFSRGDGQDQVSFEDHTGLSQDTLRFTDLNVADIELRRDGNNVVFAVKGSSDTITVKDFLLFGEPSSYFGETRPSYVEFADGTIWDLATLMDQQIISRGTNGDDFIEGHFRIRNRLEGLGGNDTLKGAGLGDTLVGGEGNDSLDGGGGNDVLEGGAGNDTYYVDSFGDVVHENIGEGNDVVYSQNGYALTAGAEIETLVLTGTAYEGIGNELNNTLVGTSGANKLDGAAGNDMLLGDDGNDILIGGAGDDTLLGGTGNDSLDGGTGIDALSGEGGNDIYYVDSSSDVVNEREGEGDDKVYATADYTLSANIENLVLVGTAYRGTGNALNNVLVGNAGANLLEGGDGNDVLQGGAGDDILVGGSGNDDYYVDSSNDQVLESAGRGSDVVYAQVDYNLSDLEEIETLVLTGTAVHGTGNDLNNRLIGNNGANLLEGEAGNDVLQGGAGDDTLRGGTGNDSYYVDSMGDVVQESAGQGNDVAYAQVDYTLTAGSEIETLVLTGAVVRGTGNELNNILVGNSAANLLEGAAGNDVLQGGAGNDVLRGGSGNDSYYVDSMGDVVQESAGEGNDLVYAQVDYALTAGSEIETLVLTGTAVRGTGNALHNILVGNAEANLLEGGAGNDVLQGGLGDDTLRGGSGDDSFYVDGNSDVVQENAGEGNDLVYARADYTLTENVERLSLVGTAIRGTGNALNNTLVGNAEANLLEGGAGNDVLQGGLGDDTLRGGSGDDSFYVDGNSDVVEENAGEGNDLVYARADYTLTENVERLSLVGTAIRGTGNALNNTLVGNAEANLLEGGAGNDVLQGGLGDDTLRGGSGDDSYYVDGNSDVVQENAGEGNDLVYARADYTLTENVERLSLVGTAIRGTGNTLNNTLLGNAEANLLEGGAGNDALVGGAGNDTLVGGVGHDSYLFQSGWGSDTLVENNAAALSNDTASFGAGIAYDQLWFTHTGNDLTVQRIGTSDTVVIKDWYDGADHHVERFKTSDGKTLADSQVEALVSAMAGLTPPAPGQTSLSPAYHDALAATLTASWH